MNKWISQFNYNPIPALLSSDQKAIHYFVQKELLDNQTISREDLWHLQQPKQILRKQLDDGAWPRSGNNKHPAVNVELIETWRNLRVLIEMYDFDKTNIQIQKAAEYVFQCQSDQGDIRGFLANQYATYYTGALLGLLIKAGYESDPRVEKGMQWLLSMRQNDGGWSIPMITHKFSKDEQYRLSSEFLPPVEPDRKKPFSHNWTGMVLRAFAEHKKYKQSNAAIHAAELLSSRFFEKDAYTSYQDANYWIRFEYPFWWNNLISAMDSISKISPGNKNPKIKKAFKWFIENQKSDGTWQYTYVPGKYIHNPKNESTNLWVTLSICRIFQRYDRE